MIFKISSVATLVMLTVSFGTVGQSMEIRKDSVYPYTFPILGQRAVDAGANMQLPSGLGINYVNSLMNIDVTDFSMWIGNDRNSDLNQFLAQQVNEETLNFIKSEAKVGGVNVRYDQYIFPFMNVYGLFSWVKGGTKVGLEPTWRDSTGEVALQLPYFESDVQFDAIAYGIGTTLAYGYQGYFISFDGNWSWTQTDLLKQDVGVVTASGRVGKNIQLKNGQAFAFYVGFMYRYFVTSEPNEGQIKLREALPALEGQVTNGMENKITSNKVTIEEIQAIPPADRTAEEREALRKAQAGNTALIPIHEKLIDNQDQIWGTQINYLIKKELLQPYTFQFGFNYQIDPQFMVRGEYGINGAQHFLLTGIQYRFGW